MRPLGRVLSGGCAVGLLLLAGALGAVGTHSYESNDFFCIWSGAHLVAQGKDPYERAVWAAATGGPHPGHDGLPTAGACTGRFAYPLWTATALVPIGVLPLGTAAALWIALAIAGTIIGMAGAWRAFDGGPDGALLLAALTLASQPFWLLLVGGQITGLLLGLVGLACVAVARERLSLGAALLAAQLLKPQLVLPLLPVVGIAALIRRLWGPVLALGTTAALFVVAAFVRDPGWAGPWLAEISDRTSGLTPRLATLWGFADDFLGTSLWAVPLVAASAAGGRWIVGPATVTPVLWLALLVPWSLAAAPHAWSYDHLLLVIPWAATLACAMRVDGRTRLVLLLALATAASAAPWLLYSVAFARGRETLSVLTPLLSLFVLATSIRIAHGPVLSLPRPDLRPRR